MSRNQTISWLTTVAAAAAAIVMFQCCDSQPADAPKAPEVADAIVEFDGLSLPRADVECYFPYLEEWDPKSGFKARRRLALERALPLALARRDFAEARAEKLVEATAVREVIGNCNELAEFCAQRDIGQEDRPWARSSLPLSVAEYAFREEHVGSVSPPIEVEQGYVLVGVRDLQRKVATAYDLVDLVLAPFYTHSQTDHQTWLNEAKTEAKATLSYVDPEYAELLPKWLQD